MQELPQQALRQNLHISSSSYQGKSRFRLLSFKVAWFFCFASLLHFGTRRVCYLARRVHPYLPCHSPHATCPCASRSPDYILHSHFTSLPAIFSAQPFFIYNSTSDFYLDLFFVTLTRSRLSPLADRLRADCSSTHSPCRNRLRFPPPTASARLLLPKSRSLSKRLPRMRANSHGRKFYISSAHLSNPSHIHQGNLTRPLSLSSSVPTRLPSASRRTSSALDLHSTATTSTRTSHRILSNTS